MTLEGEYYQKAVAAEEDDTRVAILMTLEGEYYDKNSLFHKNHYMSQSS